MATTGCPGIRTVQPSRLPAESVFQPVGQPCPRCGAKILRTRYADSETNYLEDLRRH